MKYHFYALLEKEDKFYNVSFPDLPGANTFGENLEDAIDMASDALGGHLLVMEDDHDYIPNPTNYHDLARNLKSQQQLQLVKVDTNIVRLREENKTVNKMVTLPKYMVELGKKKKINFSQTLQRALRKELELGEGHKED